MEGKRKPIRFARIRGRIVPIFGKKHSNKRKSVEGSASLAAGSAAAIGGGIATGKLAKASKTLRRNAFVANQNILAAHSVNPATKSGKLSRKRGPKGTQLNLFNKHTVKLTEKGTRLKAARRSLMSNKIFKRSKIFAHSAVGLGVDKLISATGIEETLGVEFLSEASGVATFAGIESLSRNFKDKASTGKSLRKGFGKDIMKAVKSPRLAKFAKTLFKKRFKF